MYFSIIRTPVRVRICVSSNPEPDHLIFAADLNRAPANSHIDSSLSLRRNKTVRKYHLDNLIKRYLNFSSCYKYKGKYISKLEFVKGLVRARQYIIFKIYCKQYYFREPNLEEFWGSKEISYVYVIVKLWHGQTTLLFIFVQIPGNLEILCTIRVWKCFIQAPQLINWQPCWNPCLLKHTVLNGMSCEYWPCLKGLQVKCILLRLILFTQGILQT